MSGDEHPEGPTVDLRAQACAFYAIVAAVPLTFLGIVWANPHGSSSLATGLLGMFLLLPIFTLYPLFEDTPVVGYLVVGLGQYAWTWILVISGRLCWITANPRIARARAWIQVTAVRRRTFYAASAALVALLLWPVRQVVVPPWSATFVDTQGKPLANMPVKQHWTDALESIGSGGDEER